MLQLVCGLGWMLFEALDYGCKREEQNLLSPDLEQMIDVMTSATGKSFSFAYYRFPVPLARWRRGGWTTSVRSL